MAFLTEKQLFEVGFASFGENVLISDKATFYGTDKIHIGSNVRIDDFCVLSAGQGGIQIGNYIHIAVYSSIIGAGKVTLSDFCNISSRVSIYSSNDDYSGQYMTNPMVPSEFTNVTHSPVYLGEHVIIGSGTVILPGVTLYEGVAIGALSFVTKNCEEYGIYTGAPARLLKLRTNRIKSLGSEIKKSNF